MLRLGLIIGLVSVLNQPAWASEKDVQKQAVTPASLESAIRENARQAGVSDRWVDNRLADARELRGAGIDPAPFLAKLSEGLAKRVPLNRLEMALDKQRNAVKQAHQLAGNLGRRHPETVAAAAQLLAAGAQRDDVDALFEASRAAPEPSRRFLALAFGAAGLKNAGVGWRDASRFQANLAAHDLNADDIDDVNEAVSAAVADRLLDAGDLPRLAKGELRSAGEARRFVTEIRSRGRRPADENRGQDKADKRKDHDGRSSGKDESPGHATDKETGSQGDKETRGKSAR